MSKVSVGFWPGLKPGKPDHWYIAWIDHDNPTSSAPRDPTEAEVRRAVKIINEHWEDT